MTRLPLLISQNVIGVCVFILLSVLIYINGSWVLRRFHIQTHSKKEEIVFSFALGFLLAQFCTLLLGCAGLLYPFVFRFVAAVFLIFQLKPVLRTLREMFLYMAQLSKSIFKDLIRLRNLFRAVLYLVLFRFGVIYFLGTLSPEVESDALTYHLGALRLYVENQRIFPLANLFYSNFPFGMEMLFLLGWMIQDVFVGKLFHLLVSVLLVVAIGALCRRHINSKVGLLAGLIFFTSPIVGMGSKSAYVDVALGYATFLTIYALLNYRTTREIGWIYLSGVCGGLSLTIKYSGVNTIFLACLTSYLLLLSPDGKIREQFIRSTKHVFLISVIAFAIFLPWGLKNWIFTGNPVFPFWTHVFPSQYMSVTYERTWVETVANIVPKNASFFITLPWKAAYDAEKLGGCPLGPFFLWLAPLVFFVQRKNPVIVYMLIAACAGAVLWFLQSPQIRLFLQYCALISIPTSYVVFRSETNPLLAWVSKVGVLVLLTQIWTPTWDWSREVIFGRETQEEFLAKMYPGYGYINRQLPPDAQILALSHPNQFLTSRTIWQQDTSLGGRQVAEDLFYSVFHRQPFGLMKLDIKRSTPAKHIRLTKVRPEKHSWLLFEICVYCKNSKTGSPRLVRALQARSEFRPERTSRAIDSILLTPWDSDATEKPGMTFELEINQPCMISKIVYVSKPWETPDTLTVSLSMDKITWTSIPFTGQVEIFEFPERALRDVMLSLQKEGIRYLYWEKGPEQGYFPVMKALEKDEKLYGLKRVYRNGNVAIYQIENQPQRRQICPVN